jgi:hypothetical protein
MVVLSPEIALLDPYCYTGNYTNLGKVYWNI